MSEKDKNEFLTFMNSNEEVPSSLDRTILDNVKRELHLTRQQVLPKFLIAQMIGALITLSICPQFGIGPIGGGHGLAHTFMQIGAWACAAFCGFFFLTLGTIFSTLFLNRHELKVVFDHKYWLISCTSVLSFFSLMLTGKWFNLVGLFDEVSLQSIWVLSATLFSIFYLRSLEMILRYKNLKKFYY